MKRTAYQAVHCRKCLVLKQLLTATVIIRPWTLVVTDGQIRLSAGYIECARIHHRDIRECMRSFKNTDLQQCLLLGRR